MFIILHRDGCKRLLRLGYVFKSLQHAHEIAIIATMLVPLLCSKIVPENYSGKRGSSCMNLNIFSYFEKKFLKNFAWQRVLGVIFMIKICINPFPTTNFHYIFYTNAFEQTASRKKNILVKYAIVRVTT